MERRFIPTLQPPCRPLCPPREEAADFFFFFLSFLFGDGETLAITSISQRHGFEYPQPSRLVFFFIMSRTGKLPSPSFYRHIPLSSAYRQALSLHTVIPHLLLASPLPPPSQIQSGRKNNP